MPPDAKHCHYLNAMGVPVWLARGHDRPLSDSAPTVQAAQVDVQHGEGNAKWQALQQRVRGCTACRLAKGRTQTVFGVGDPQADLLIIGEAPGAEEDRRGEPFVGRAGKLLDAMLQAMGLERGQVFIANILKCRPPDNRDPQAEEVAACRPHLTEQIALIAPRLILALGRVAAQNLLQTNTPIGRMRGRQYRYGEAGIAVVVSYHPAYLLRSPREKRKSWQDLQLAMRLLAAP